MSNRVSKMRRGSVAERAIGSREERVAPSDPVTVWLSAMRQHLLLLAVVVLAVFLRALRNGFAFDDALVIVDTKDFLLNPSLGDFFSQRYFELSGEATYRPIVTLTYLIDAQLGGMDPFMYHLQSVAWHAGVAMLVYAVAKRFTASPWAALAAALLFAVHPVVTEAIDNPSYREDPLVAFFTLAALLLALRNTKNALYGAGVCYAVALFSKESAVVMPLLLVGARLLLPEPRAALRRRWLPELMMFGSLTGVYALVRFSLMKGPLSFGEYPGGSLRSVVGTEPSVIAHYLRLLVLPFGLCADYRGIYDFSTGITRTTVLYTGMLVAILAAIVWMYRIDRFAAFAAGWFFVALLPVVNLVPIPVPAGERYLYLPLVGVCMAVGRGAQLASQALGPRGRRMLIATGCGVIAVFAIATNLRHPIWDSSLTLFSKTAEAFPLSYGAHWGRGVHVYRTTNDIDTAIYELETAQRLNPNRSDGARIAQGLKVLYDKRGRPEDSLRVSVAYAEREATHESFMSLGREMLSAGRPAEAKRAFERGIKLPPYTFNAKAYAMLAQIALNEGNKKEADELIKQALRIDAKDGDVQGVAMSVFRATQNNAPTQPPPDLLVSP